MIFIIKKINLKSENIDKYYVFYKLILIYIVKYNYL